MEEALGPIEDHLLPGPHLRRDAGKHAGSDFAPLRLLLEPSRLSIEVTRPDVIVGRHSGADVRLAFLEVSRRHCRLYFVAGVWRVTDLTSVNGVFINGTRIQEATLYPGDTLHIGTFTFTIDYTPTVPERHEVLQSIVEVIKEKRCA